MLLGRSLQLEKMKIEIGNKSIEFSQYTNHENNTKRNDWHGKLLIDNEMVEFEIYGQCWNCMNTIDRNIDWECVGLFLNHYQSNHSNQVKRSKKYLKYLVNEIGWWDEKDLKVGEFNFTGVTIKTMFCHGSSKKYDKFEDYEYDLYFAFEGDESRFYIDIYGLWIVSYKGKYLLGFRREQL